MRSDLRNEALEAITSMGQKVNCPKLTRIRSLRLHTTSPSDGKLRRREKLPLTHFHCERVGRVRDSAALAREAVHHQVIR